MPFDETLADRVRAALYATVKPSSVEEKRMFGGIAFMVNGHMAVGITKDRLMVRLDPDEAGEAIRKREHARPMDFTGKPMRGFLFIDAAGTGSDAELAKWVRRGAEFAKERPVKQRKQER